MKLTLFEIVAGLAPATLIGAAAYTSHVYFAPAPAKAVQEVQAAPPAQPMPAVPQWQQLEKRLKSLESEVAAVSPTPPPRHNHQPVLEAFWKGRAAPRSHDIPRYWRPQPARHGAPLTKEAEVRRLNLLETQR